MTRELDAVRAATRVLTLLATEAETVTYARAMADVRGACDAIETYGPGHYLDDEGEAPVAATPPSPSPSAVITTPAELDALPVGSVIRDEQGNVMPREMAGWLYDNCCYRHCGSSGDQIALPATVLYRPDAAPAPVSDDAVEQAARVMYEAARLPAAPAWAESDGHEHDGFRADARALAAAGLLASSPRTITPEQRTWAQWAVRFKGGRIELCATRERAEALIAQMDLEPDLALVSRTVTDWVEVER